MSNKTSKRSKFVKAYHRKSNKMKIMVRDGKRCAYCDADNVDLNLDHIIPKSRGGSSSLSNLVLSCYECNLIKGNLLPHEIHDKMLSEKVKALRRYANSMERGR